MDCKVKKGIYILDNRALDWLEKQGNQSKYITDLILSDINDKGITRDEVIKIIEEKLKSCTVNNTDIVDSTKKVDKNAKKIARDLFNI